MPKDAVNMITATYIGDPGVSAHQVYSNNGIVIEKGQAVTLTPQTLPVGFPFSLDELADQLRAVPGMEVA